VGVDPSGAGRRRRRLAPSEKYELYLEVLTGAGDAAGGGRAMEGGPLDGGSRLPGRQAGRIGRVGRVGAGAAGSDRGASGDGRGPGGDRAAPGHGHRAGRGDPSRGGKSTLGLSAGPVPSRVDACVKAGLLDLVDHAVDAGWSSRRRPPGSASHRRECGVDRPCPGAAPRYTACWPPNGPRS